MFKSALITGLAGGARIYRCLDPCIGRRLTADGGHGGCGTTADTMAAGTAASSRLGRRRLGLGPRRRACGWRFGGWRLGAYDYYDAPVYGSDYYDDGCVRYPAIYDQWGNYLGRRCLLINAFATSSPRAWRSWPRFGGAFFMAFGQKHAAGDRRRRAGCRRERKRQLSPRSQSQMREARRLDEVAILADRLDRLDRDAEPSGKPRHQRRIAPAAAADQPTPRRLAGVLERRRRRLDGEGGERRRAVRVGERLDVARSARENGCGRAIWAPAGGNRGRASKSATRSLVDRPRAASAPFSSCERPRRRRTKSSISALAGPVSKATISPSGAEIGDVADAAPIQEHQRPLQTRRERRVVERNQRRAFAARRDVGGAKIADDVDAEPAPPRARRRKAGG